MLYSKNAIIIYARMSSNRLPGKALMPIGNFKLIELVINRVKKVNKAVEADIILATTNLEVDNVLEELADEMGILSFRGNPTNLVERTTALLKNGAYANFCRVNGDCPFVDTDLITLGYQFLKDKNLDFVSNIIERTFPYGVALEWVKSSLFVNLADKALPNELEHVTMHLYRLIAQIKHHNILNKVKQNEIRLTIDTKEDYLKISNHFNKINKEEQINLSFTDII